MIRTNPNNAKFKSTKGLGGPNLWISATGEVRYLADFDVWDAQASSTAQPMYTHPLTAQVSLVDELGKHVYGEKYNRTVTVASHSDFSIQCVKHHTTGMCYVNEYWAGVHHGCFAKKWIDSHMFHHLRRISFRDYLATQPQLRSVPPLAYLEAQRDKATARQYLKKVENITKLIAAYTRAEIEAKTAVDDTGHLTYLAEKAFVAAPIAAWIEKYAAIEMGQNNTTHHVVTALKRLEAELDKYHAASKNALTLASAASLKDLFNALNTLAVFPRKEGRPVLDRKLTCKLKVANLIIYLPGQSIDVAIEYLQHINNITAALERKHEPLPLQTMTPKMADKVLRKAKADDIWAQIQSRTSQV